MKNLFFAFTLIFSLNLCAQNTFENTKIFVRVYDLQGNKINKGRILSISESALQLERKGNTIDIPASDIGTIKTKYSGGNNVLIGAIAGTGAGFFSGDPVVIAAGAGVGAAVGGLTVLFKKSETFEIEGDKTKLKALEDLLIE
ncbi:hypothetical protein [uncultured Formosa sp.]|uniref:hypothetical protein n=1 Tax=uncultured Formosa sp. TaxID=255435 RepID=UPI00261812F9|nr:hypothetical protein [uncultured Formosa sp.]